MQEVKRSDTYSIDVKGQCVKILINDLIHVAWKVDSFVGIQSHINGPGWYTIIIHTTSGNEIKLDYDDRGRWESILKVMHKVC